MSLSLHIQRRHRCIQPQADRHDCTVSCSSGLVGYALLRGLEDHGGRNAVTDDFLLGRRIGREVASPVSVLRLGSSRPASAANCAVSRRRGVLNQFTRNPNGMAGALKRIGATTAELQ